MEKQILTNCRGLAVTDENEFGSSMRARYETIRRGADDAVGEVSAARHFVAGDHVTFLHDSQDGDFSCCEDRTGSAWWIPSEKLA